MSIDKAEFVREYFGNMEHVVQFGDTKASLMVAGDAILLAISGGVVRMVADCPGGELSFTCIKPSLSLAIALTASVLLIASISFALAAARPSQKHGDPPREFFLLSYVARMPRAEFIEWYRSMSTENLLEGSLVAVHGKAEYARTKFRWLKRAVDTTLLSLLLLLAALVMGAISR